MVDAEVMIKTSETSTATQPGKPQESSEVQSPKNPETPRSRLQEEKEEAKKRVLRKSEKPQAVQQAREKIQEKINRSQQQADSEGIVAVLGLKEPPQSEAALIILSDVAGDEKMLQDQFRVGQVIMELSVAANNTADQTTKNELIHYKKAFSRQLGNLAVKEAEWLGNVRNEQDRSALKQTVDTFAEQVGEIITPDKYYQRLKSGKLKTIPGGGPAIQGLRMYDESSEDFRAFSPEARDIIQAVNRRAEKNPSSFTLHYLESIANDIDRNSAIPTPEKEKLASRLEEIGGRVIQAEAQEKRIEQVGRQVETITDFENKREVHELIERVSGERRKLPGERVIRDDVLDLVEQGYLSVDPRSSNVLKQILANMDNTINTGGLRTEEAQFLEQASSALTKRAEEVERMLRSGAMRGINFGRYGYTPEEQDFIENILFNPTDSFKYIARHGYETFEKEIKKTFNKLYSKANENPRDPFDHSFSSLHDQPVLEQFLRSLYLIAEQYKAHPETVPDALRGALYPIQEFGAIRIGLNKPEETKQFHLDERIDILREKMSRDFEIAQYTHNVYFIMLTRGKLESLAGYGNKAHAVDIDALFHNEQLVQEAYYFFINEVRKALTNNFREIDPTFFAADPHTFREHFEEKVKEKLKLLHKGTIEDWEIDRAVSLGRGASMGITGELLDVLAEADAPKGEAAFRGYFGDVVAGAINPMHTVARFHPGKISDIFYTMLRKKGTSGGWNYKEIEETKKHLEQTLSTSGLDGTPIVEMLNLLGSGSVMARKGWRLTGATKHLVTGLGYERIGDKERYTWTDVNPEETWINLKKAGLGIAYEWAKTIRDIKKEKVTPQEWEKVKQLQEKINVTSVLQEVKEKNPLKFLYDFDKSKKWEGSLRQRVAQSINEFKDKDYSAIVTRLNEVEDHLLIIQRKAISEGRAIQENDFDLLTDAGVSANDVDLTKQYWRSLNTIISIQKEGDDIYFASGKKFKDPQFFFGTEDFNFDEIRFMEGGASLVGRIFGDMNGLATAADNFLHQFEPTLIASAKAGDYGEIIKLNSATRSVLQSIHGESRAAQMSYIIDLMTCRFFQKNLRARMPLLVGTTVGLVSGKESLSQIYGGRRAWAWDEQVTGAYIADSVAAGNLPSQALVEKLEKEGTHIEFSDTMLKKEVGARNWQITYDVLRTALPLLLLLIAWQAAQEETKQ